MYVVYYLILGVCPENEKAYINALDMSVRECLINEPSSCANDYLCRFNPQKNRYFCCASITKSMIILSILIINHYIDYCPIGRAPYKEPITHVIQRCTMNSVSNGCPDGFSCQSELKGALQGYCCSVNGI